MNSVLVYIFLIGNNILIIATGGTPTYIEGKDECTNTKDLQLIVIILTII